MTLPTPDDAAQLALEVESARLEGTDGPDVPTLVPYLEAIAGYDRATAALVDACCAHLVSLVRLEYPDACVLELWADRLDDGEPMLWPSAVLDVNRLTIANLDDEGPNDWATEILHGALAWLAVALERDGGPPVVAVDLTDGLLVR